MTNFSQDVSILARIQTGHLLIRSLSKSSLFGESRTQVFLQLKISLWKQHVLYQV